MSQGETSRMALSSLTMGPSAGVVTGSFSSSLAALGVSKTGLGTFSEGTPFLALSRFFTGQGPVWMNQPSEGGHRGAGWLTPVSWQPAGPAALRL